MLQAAKRIAPGREFILTVTHAHPAHGFGAQVFLNDGKIYYNTLQKEYFARAGKTYLDVFRNGFVPPQYVSVLDDIKLTPPTETYDGGVAKIDLGGRIVELRNWGTAHSPGDQIAYLPEEGIIFPGDLIEE